MSSGFFRLEGKESGGGGGGEGQQHVSAGGGGGGAWIPRESDPLGGYMADVGKLLQEAQRVQNFQLTVVPVGERKHASSCHCPGGVHTLQGLNSYQHRERFPPPPRCPALSDILLLAHFLSPFPRLLFSSGSPFFLEARRMHFFRKKSTGPLELRFCRRRVSLWRCSFPSSSLCVEPHLPLVLSASVLYSFNLGHFHVYRGLTYV